VSRGAVSRQSCARPHRSGRPMVRSSAQAADRRFQQNQPHDDHAGVSSNRGADARGPGLARQTHFERGADRGRGGFSDDPPGLTVESRTSRRAFLRVAGAVVAGVGLGPVALVRPARATSAAMQDAIGKVVGAARITSGKVKLELPPLSENGNTVPLTVSVQSPMTARDHVRAIHVFTEKNPQPEVVSFYLGPRAGRATVATRIRLADTQTVTAI